MSDCRYLPRHESAMRALEIATDCAASKRGIALSDSVRPSGGRVPAPFCISVIHPDVPDRQTHWPIRLVCLTAGLSKVVPTDCLNEECRYSIGLWPETGDDDR